jgi:TonB family protein
MDENNLVDQIPPTIGRYKVVQGIGFGAMGAVYKAFDPLIKRTLAIKTIRLDIPRQSPQYKSFIERFYHEARVSGTLSHPNIVTLFDIGEESGLPYLAMEFVEGETIASILERGTRFEPEKVVVLVSQIASALDYAHSKGVIHRDVKPANLMLYEGDRVKVTDFGIAKLMDAEMTQAGVLLGTPSYMSPEQAMGDKLDGRTDIFSLGVCAFEMMSGEQPFPGTNVTSILYKLVHVDPIEPANLEMNGLVPAKWHEVFGKVLAKKPEDRYQTAGTFVRDLEYCLGSWFGALDSEKTIAVAATPETERTATIRRPVAASPSASEEESPSTVILKAPPPPADDSVTVVLKAPKGPPRRPVAPAPPPPVEEDSATVVLSGLPELDDDPTTLVLKSPETIRAKALNRPPASPEDTRPLPGFMATAPEPGSDGGAPTRAISRPPGAPAPGTRAPSSGLSPITLLGGAGALFVVAAAVVGFLLLRGRGKEEPAPTPTPTVMAVGTPAPAPSPSAPVEAAGTIRVETQPPGAAVTVNGETRGVAPLELTGLAFGAYQIKLDLRGYLSRAESVEVTEDAPQAELRVALTRAAPADGTADILSTPFGAAVSVDGARLGVTPLSDLKLKPGPRRVEMTRDGYEPWSATLNVQAGKRTRLDAQLRAVVKAAPTPEPAREVVDTSKVYLPSQVDTPPKKVSGTTASYPEGRAPKLKSGQSISVVVSWVVNESGEVTEVTVVEPASRPVDEAVTSAIASWKYKPAIKRGVKVKVKLTLKQTFQSG